MPKIMHASVAIDLPADEFEEAVTKLKVKPAWDNFLKALKEAGVNCKHELLTNETKAKAASNGAKRGRPAKVTAAVGATPVMDAGGQS